MKRIGLSLALLMMTAMSAHAAEVAINQKGKKFSEKKVTIAVGDSLKFVNDDGTTHNVHSRTKGHDFDLGAQEPGTEATHTFSKAGKVKVRCAIHPKMKMTVMVE